MATEIMVTVTGTPPDGTYNSSSTKVQSNGNITVNPGITNVGFIPGRGQTWNFQSPWITFNPAGPFTVTLGGSSAVQIQDNDPGGGQDQTFEYTLYTTQGNFDPALINKGGTG